MDSCDGDYGAANRHTIGMQDEAKTNVLSRVTVNLYYMNTKQRNARSQTTWYVINIKARREQNPAHYVDAFRKLQIEDPLVQVYGKKYISIRSLHESETMEVAGVPQWMKVCLAHYTNVDSDAFYNKRKREDVQLAWNEDIVANKNEAELYFVPSVHKLAVRRCSKISLKNIVLYLKGALDKVEPEGFDVTVVLDQDMIARILNASTILSFEANISYSNPGHTSGFRSLFEDKVHSLNPDKFSLYALGTVDNPLVKDEDGIIETATKLAEENGSVNATIVEKPGGKRVRLDSKDHPRILLVPRFINKDLVNSLYNTLMSVFGNRG